MRIQDKRRLVTGLLATLMVSSVQAADKKRHAPTREELLAEARSGAGRQCRRPDRARGGADARRAGHARGNFRPDGGNRDDRGRGSSVRAGAGAGHSLRRIADVRQAAMRAAQIIAPLPADLSAALQAATTDRDPLVSAVAAQGIQQAAGKARERAVREARSVDEVRRAAGMEVEDTVAIWAKALRTEATEDERVMTAEAIGGMGTGGPDVGDIDAFAVVLSEALPLERSARVRAAIAEALGDLSGIKADKATATAALRAALKDADPAVRQAAQKALPRVGAH